MGWKRERETGRVKKKRSALRDFRKRVRGISASLLATRARRLTAKVKCLRIRQLHSKENFNKS